MAVIACHAATGVLAPVQKAFTGWSLRQLPAPDAREVLFLAIDEASIESLGPWPWPRELHARLIDRLTEAEAGAVAYTVPWNGAEPREALNQLSRLAEAVAADPTLAEHAELTGWMQQSQVLLDGDSRLAESLTQNRRTVLAVGPSASPDAGWPLASLASAAAGVGHVDLPPDAEDGVVHALPLLEQRGDRWLPALSLAAVAAWRREAITHLHWRRDGLGGRFAALGEWRWPLDAEGRIEPIWPAVAGPANNGPWIAQWSAAALLAGKLPPGGLKDRLVVVGLQTPDPAAGWRVTVTGDHSTAYLVAATAAALIHGNVLARPGWAGITSGALLLAVLACTVAGLPRLHPRSRLAATVLATTLMLACAHLVVIALRTEIPVVLPISTLLAGHLAIAWVRRPAAAPTAAASSTAAPFARPAAPAPAAAPAPPAPAPVQADAGTAPTAPIPLRAEPLPRWSGPAPGRMLGRFELLQEIGRGAMGRVYRARHVDSGETVAVKTLALAREFDGFALQEAQLRFQREALAASRLQHPDIVRTLATGDREGLVWIAMELLEGHDLVRHTTDGKLLPVPVVLDICARIAAALAHAHAHGVVHRDIKPANVMVNLDPSHRHRPSVKVTDFGIARITDAARTRTGLVLGSPSYMSPEHLAGRTVDGRSDLYSLGVLLFQLLTGQLPFQGSNVAELMHAVANQPAPDVRQLRPRLPEIVSNIVTLALEKRPELRYADGLQMAHDLRSVTALWPPMWAPEPAGAAARTAGQTSTTV